MLEIFHLAYIYSSLKSDSEYLGTLPRSGGPCTHAGAAWPVDLLAVSLAHVPSCLRLSSCMRRAPSRPPGPPRPDCLSAQLPDCRLSGFSLPGPARPPQSGLLCGPASESALQSSGRGTDGPPPAPAAGLGCCGPEDRTARAKAGARDSGLARDGQLPVKVGGLYRFAPFHAASD